MEEGQITREQIASTIDKVFAHVTSGACGAEMIYLRHPNRVIYGTITRYMLHIHSTHTHTHIISLTFITNHIFFPVRQKKVNKVNIYILLKHIAVVEPKDEYECFLN